MTSPRPRPRLALLLVGAFCLTLSLLTLRDRLDVPQRVDVALEAPPAWVLARG